MGLAKTKLIISVILIVSGAFLGVSLTHEETYSEKSVMTLDFGNYLVDSVEVDEDNNASEALFSMCATLGYAVKYDSDGNIKTINNLPGTGDDRTWGLYTLELDDATGWGWKKYADSPSALKVSSTKSLSWGLCSEGETPSPVSDATGFIFYGLGEAKTIVCLAPSCTETVCELGYEDRIIGTDRYSNYPASIQHKRETGIIAETGSYTTPNFEIIVKLNPDLVIGISDQLGHIKVAEKLRIVGINTIIVPSGESIESVYDGTFMSGVAIGDPVKAHDVTVRLGELVEKTNGYVSHTLQRPDILVTLSTDKSPWIAGVDTYISDIFGKSGAYNTFDKSHNPHIEDSVYGWRQVNSESIVQADPDYIFVITDGTETDYSLLLNDIPKEWKYTEAYKNGNIYYVIGSAADMISRPSTRLAQVTELVGRIIHPDAFPEFIEVPKTVGNDYPDYLTYSKERQL